MLRQFCCGDDDFSCADIVVGDKNDLEQVLGYLIVIDDVRDLIDELNNLFGIFVARGGFPTEHDSPGYDFGSFLLGHFFNGEIPVDDVENIHELPLVLVYPLDLDIKHGMLINVNVTQLLNPLNQSLLIHLLDGLPLGLEILIFNILLQIMQFVHISEPLISQQFGTVEFGQFWIGTCYPPTGCDSVGDVDEFMGEDLVEGPE